MKNDIEFTLKNLNGERTLSKVLQICEVKDVKIKDDCFSFIVNKKYKKRVQALLSKQEIMVINKKGKGLISFFNSTIFRIGIIIPIMVYLFLELPI